MGAGGGRWLDGHNVKRLGCGLGGGRRWVVAGAGTMLAVRVYKVYGDRWWAVGAEWVGTRL